MKAKQDLSPVLLSLPESQTLIHYRKWVFLYLSPMGFSRFGVFKSESNGYGMEWPDIRILPNYDYCYSSCNLLTGLTIACISLSCSMPI